MQGTIGASHGNPVVHQQTVAEAGAVIAATEPRSLIDIGAYCGMWSVVGAINNAYVWAFEPCPMSFHWMSRHLDQNTVWSRVEPYQLAVSNETGKLIPLYSIAVDLAQTGAYYAPSKVVWQAVTISLDDVLDHIVGQPVDLIKVDAEGMERLLLPSLLANAHRIKYVWLEPHPPLVDADIIRAAMHEQYEPHDTVDLLWVSNAYSR